MAMIILGAETSCDETAIAILEIKNSKIKVLSNVVSSQIKLHAKFGGVVPNLAAREHVKNIGHVFKLALKKSQIKINDIDWRVGGICIFVRVFWGEKEIYEANYYNDDYND